MSLTNAFSKIKHYVLKRNSLPSFEEYRYTKEISLEQWVDNIKYVFNYTKLPWLRKYDALFEDIYNFYSDEIPFHNHVHVYDVFQLGVCLLTRNKIALQGITDIEKFTFCIALLCHDIDHRGYTNSEIAKDSTIYDDDKVCGEEYCNVEYCNDDMYVMMTRRSSSISSVCSSSSYNEIHHILCASKILQKHRIKYDEFLFAKLISYTDLVTHKSFLEKTEYVDFVGQKPSNEHILILFMKLADIGHILRPWNTHLDFVTSMNKERQTPMERELLPKDTLWFNDMFVLPVIEKIKEINIGLYYRLLSLYKRNTYKWKDIQCFTDKLE